MSAFDWPRAAKRAYIARFGSVPYWIDLLHDEPRRSRTTRSAEESLRGRALGNELRKSYGLILRGYRSLDVSERLAEHTRFEARIRCVAIDVRRPMSHYLRRRYQPLIDREQRRALEELAILRGRVPASADGDAAEASGDVPEELAIRVRFVGDSIHLAWDPIEPRPASLLFALARDGMAAPLHSRFLRAASTSLRFRLRGDRRYRVRIYAHNGPQLVARGEATLDLSTDRRNA